MRRLTIFLLIVAVAGVVPCYSQETSGPEAPNLEAYFRSYVGLSGGQLTALRTGETVSKTLHSRSPAEIFVFGAVYVNASPESYIAFANDLERLRKISGFVALGKFSTPPQLRDLNGFTFDSDDIESLKRCKPGDCDVQMPESAMRTVQNAIDWSAPNVSTQVNELLQKTALDRFLAYQQEGNTALGVYNDKEHPTNVANQFQYILSYTKVLPERFPGFYRYLLTYPSGKPPKVEDSFYWAKVKFGLKPTLRMVHVVTMSRNTVHGRGYVIAEKQLYASHYFQTALDLTFCIPEQLGTQRGFYLIKLMGSEQAGLSGFNGSIVRKVAVSRSASSLQKSLSAIKDALEAGERDSGSVQ